MRVSPFLHLATLALTGVGFAVVGTAQAQTPLLDAQAAAFCAAPERAPMVPTLMASSVTAAREAGRVAGAAWAASSASPYDPAARQAALRLRDDAALAWWRIDLECLRQPRRAALVVARDTAGQARLEAMAASQRYAALEASGASAKALALAFDDLKAAQTRMWDAREAQDAAVLAVRTVRLAAQVRRGDPRIQTLLQQRNQLTTTLAALDVATDPAQTARLRQRAEGLRAASLAFAPTAVTPPGAVAELPAYPPGSDYQARRPDVLPVLPVKLAR